MRVEQSKGVGVNRCWGHSEGFLATVLGLSLLTFASKLWAGTAKATRDCNLKLRVAGASVQGKGHKIGNLQRTLLVRALLPLCLFNLALADLVRRLRREE